MNRRASPRLLMCVLLAWQLGAGAWLEAAPLAAVTHPQSMHAGTTHAGPTHAHPNPCAEQGGAARRGAPPGAVASHGSANCDASQAGSDCCVQAACSSDCAGLSAVAVARSAAPRAVPDHPAVIDIVAPRIEPRVVEFLRPPI